jgi:hypothetical protein
MTNSGQPYFSDTSVNKILSTLKLGFLIAGLTIVLCRMASCEEKRYVPIPKVAK